MQKCLEVIEITALDFNFKRMVRLASTSPCIRAEVFEVNVEPDKTTSLEFCHTTPVIFRFNDGWHIAYRSIKLIGGKDYGPPYLDDVWVDENHRHLLIEYQI
jgi:hypothetical protein